MKNPRVSVPFLPATGPGLAAGFFLLLGLGVSICPTVSAAFAQQAYVKASNTGPNDAFGGSVALSGDTMVVGAHYESSDATGVNGNQSDNSVSFSGAAYVFARSGTSWSQQAYLKASNTGTRNYFGRSVAVSGDLVVIGAMQESSTATNINGSQTNVGLSAYGAAYAFVRDGTNWSQQAYLKASNAGMGDFFGASAAVSGDTVVIGAPGEDSNAIGVNGAQSENSANGSGAVYVFTGLGAGPRLALAPDGTGGYVLHFTGAPDATYRLQRAIDLAGPWHTVGSFTAPASGFVEYRDATPLPGQAFYRTAQP
jgi:FG-GAP repeat protein